MNEIHGKNGDIKYCPDCKITLTINNCLKSCIKAQNYICKDCKNKRNKNERIFLRKKVINAYGGKCNCCGETIWQFLTIDHVNGDGNIERKNNINCEKLYRKIIKENYPTNYQILCYNCNCTKGFMGSCPHKRI